MKTMIFENLTDSQDFPDIEDSVRRLENAQEIYNSIIPNDPGDSGRLNQVKVGMESLHSDLSRAYKSPKSSPAYKKHLLAVMNGCSSLIQVIDEVIS